MNAVVQRREATYEPVSARPPVVREFALWATDHAGVPRLRELILTLAVQGRLVRQEHGEESAHLLLERLQGSRLGAGGKVRHEGTSAAGERPFAIPSNWAWAQLDELSARGLTDGDWIETKDQDPAGEVRLIQLADIGDGTFKDKSSRFVSSETRIALNCTLLQPFDVLIARLPSPVGRACVFPGINRPAITAVDVAICRVGEGIEPTYLALAINAPQTRSVVESYGKGATRFRVSTGHLKRLPIPLPPTKEQARIVARVDELMRLCDALEAKSRLQAEQHARLMTTVLGTLTDSRSPEELAANWQRVAAHFDLLLDRPDAVDAVQAVTLQLAVRGLLVGVNVTTGDEPLKRDQVSSAARQLPSGWREVRVGDVVNMLNGFAFKSDWFKRDGIRLVRNTNVGHGTLDWEQTVCLPTAFASDFLQFSLAEGDLVLSLDRPIISTGLKVARVRKVDLPCLLLQRVARLQPDPGVLSIDFLALWLLSDRFVNVIDPGRSNGVPHISTKQIANMVLWLPPLEEQHRIVARVDELRRLNAHLRERLTAQQATQARLADSLVASATA